VEGRGAAAAGSQPAQTRRSVVVEVAADAPKVVWALDFQFDSTIDGKAIKIASMLIGQVHSIRRDGRKTRQPAHRRGG
jgi:hypothetical protein